MAERRHRHLGQSLLLSQGGRRLPAGGGSHPLAGDDQGIRPGRPRGGGVAAMAITVSPFAAGLGADIGGVDIRRPLLPADRDAIRAAWLANLVLRLRGQPMTDEEHMAFTRHFGELEYSAYGLVAKEYGVKSEIDSRGKTRPEIAVISNILERGKPIGGLGHGEAFWHTDSSFVEIPPAGSFLRAIEIPPEGGATYFLNMYSAYESLPEDLKERI